MFNGKTHYKWPFTIAMLNYQRVLYLIILPHANFHHFLQHVQVPIPQLTHQKLYLPSFTMICYDLLTSIPHEFP